MQNQWILMEHYRLHTVETWPDSPYKRATLAAIHSSLESLSQDRAAESALSCAVCQGLKNISAGSEFFHRRQIHARPTSLAA